MNNEPVRIKASYTKPTITEYGSLAERTQTFLMFNPEDEFTPAAVTTVVTPSITTVAV